MHRMIEATVPPASSGPLRQALSQEPEVLSLSISKAASDKPGGDVLKIFVLNNGADRVLELVRKHCGDNHFVVTSEVASITDPSRQKLINNDVDEAIWEELETGLRHNGKVTTNFCILMAIGGIITAVGFVADVQMQVIAFISASIIAPGLEPIVKMPLGIVLKKKDVFLSGVKAFFLGYLLLMLGSALTFWLLLALGATTTEAFLTDDLAIALTHVTPNDAILSIAATVASIIMYVSYRRHVIAGPLIALVIIPAAAGAAMALVATEWNIALKMLYRLEVDMILIIVIGIILIWLKQKLVHKRMPLR